MNITASDRERLYSEYLKLPEAEQIIMEFYSIQYFFIYSTQSLQILQNLKINKTIDKYSKEDFEAVIEKLRTKNLLGGRSKGENACNPEVSELITQNSIRRGTFSQIAPEITATGSRRNMSEENKLFVLARINLYSGKDNIFEGLKEKFSALQGYFGPLSSEVEEELLGIFLNPFSEKFLESGVLHRNYLERFFINVMFHSVMNSVFHPEAAEYIVQKSLNSEVYIPAAEYVHKHLLLQGRVKEAETITKKYFSREPGKVPAFSAFEAFMKGNFAEAAEFYSEENRRVRTLLKKKNAELEGFPAFLYYISLIKLKDYKNAYEYSYKIMNMRNHDNTNEFILLHSFSERVNGSFKEQGFRILPPDAGSVSHWQVLIVYLAFYWMDMNPSSGHLNLLQFWCRQSQSAGYRWLEMQFYDLLAKFSSDAVYAKKAEQIRKETGAFFVSEVYEKQEKWLLALNALRTLNSPDEKIEKMNYDKRLAWFINYNEETGEFSIQPYEQSFNSSKGWTGGRQVALKRLKNEASKLPFLSEQDHRLISHIRLMSSVPYGTPDAVLMHTAAPELVGHPHIYLSGTNMHIELQSANPELRVIQMKNGMYHITVHPPRKDYSVPYSLDMETPTRFRLTVFSQDHDKISQIIGRHGIKVPAEGKNEILNAVTSLSSLLTVQSDIGGGEELNAETVPASAKLHIQLIPFSGGVRIAAAVRPFGDFGPYCRPGIGGSNLITDHSDRKFHTSRDLQEEKLNLNELLKSSPVLNSIGSDSGTEWILDDMEACLEVLLELQNMHDKIIIEWPEGEKYRLSGGLDRSSFRIGIRKENDWFSVSGEVKINNEEVMEMQKLLDLLENSPGRFLRMSDGTFMAMTEELKKQLNDFKNYSESFKDGYRFSPLVAPILEEMTEGMEKVKIDKAWKDQLKKLDDLKNFKPVLPKTFQASLRDYQQEGFEWMAKLSKWGVGACLADDMGLGKTIQSLAMLLTFAPKGPSLVIAPTSVCMNWHSEAARFAPTLNTVQFGVGDREKMIKNLKSFDLLICSYGMLQQTEAADLLKDIEWKMVILDEAQAVKNMSTKRSQAVMNLKADFKLITTGTPIENHLGELWNLFRFLNPGLLGSLEKFNEKYAVPIERNQDRYSRNRLKKLIQPFILRRMKNDVLEELPEKTEITIQVELSGREKAFYEALRQNAIKKLSGEDMHKGQKHIQILAEIMKLRRACCHSSLVDKKIDIPSAKFEAFTEILEELLENRHKALVFSQFTDHLSIIKKHLDTLKINYQYLDGSTPAGERKKRVEKFQSGEGDVFLISLKAGGAGLNLTAADYVIHMDPWWNPAVEDQASDRAHRMGQKRPVTVYRIVAKDTIEEKIVELHKHKRDLADSLLEESEMSGKMSADELLKLLRGEE